MKFVANLSQSSKVFIVAWFTIIHSIAYVLFKDNRGPQFLEMNVCKWITRQHLRCQHGNIFKNFDDFFAGKCYITMKKKLMICLDFIFCSIQGDLKMIVGKLISVLLDAAWQPENIDGENKWCLCTLTNQNCWSNFKIT